MKNNNIFVHFNLKSLNFRSKHFGIILKLVIANTEGAGEGVPSCLKG